ncbi:hypothetical protein DID88_003935 [Monilinia fructigena]|uniref:NAD-dependent epimerase/dehydratase domain-containing protein n=1 Tax=Monilinia fructigena TaxID=38457 RepID=A0A395IT89_9HELO|nr:hypothetical protein DID88_003935 [Monilinia fructigena]
MPGSTYYSTDSGASSPERVFSGNESNALDTPLTERSLIFDADDIDFAVRNVVNDQWILVVGGLGFIGSHTVWELAKAGYNLELMVSQHYNLQGKDGHRPSLKFHDADFRNINKMNTILEEYDYPGIMSFGSSSDTLFNGQRSCISGVIHFAAYKAVEESIHQPLKYYSNNVGGLVDFCSLLQRFGIKKMVFSSSATVYGTVADTGVPLREEYVVGSGCAGLTNPMDAQNGSLSNRPNGGFKVYNLGTGQGYSVLDVVSAMEQATNSKIPIRIVGRRGGDVGKCIALADKAEKELMWKTEKSLADCCEDLWRFLEGSAIAKGQSY